MRGHDHGNVESAPERYDTPSHCKVSHKHLGAAQDSLKPVAPAKGDHICSPEVTLQKSEHSSDVMKS